MGMSLVCSASVGNLMFIGYMELALPLTGCCNMESWYHFSYLVALKKAYQSMHLTKDVR